MRKDYEKIASNKDLFHDFSNNISEKNLFIFESALNAENVKEFDLTVENYELRCENDELKRKIEEFESSKSWKITKPLRGIRK